MAPLEIPRNNNQVVIDQRILDLLQIYQDAGYTEEMYQGLTESIFETLANHYDILEPQELIRLGRANLFRDVIRLYAEQVPLFEIEAFGV